jgi:NAD(P)-dependent dehydrogenase (short-subunit alcohol dehydrogenase family)
MGSLDGKVALVTGSGSGLGRACARLFSREGAKVIVADIRPEGGEETVELIKQAGARRGSSPPTSPSPTRCKRWSGRRWTPTAASTAR